MNDQDLDPVPFIPVHNHPSLGLRDWLEEVRTLAFKCDWTYRNVSELTEVVQCLQDLREERECPWTPSKEELVSLAKAIQIH